MWRSHIVFFLCCSQNLLRSPRKPTRKISKIPFKVLDAPELQDDFYLNLVDWSSLNVLSVGLGTCVYLWSACTSQVNQSFSYIFWNRLGSTAWCTIMFVISQVTRLCDLTVEGDSVTSVGWSERVSISLLLFLLHCLLNVYTHTLILIYKIYFFYWLILGQFGGRRDTQRLCPDLGCWGWKKTVYLGRTHSKSWWEHVQKDLN